MNKTWVAAAATVVLGATGPAWGEPPKLMNPDVEHSAVRALEAEGQRIEQRYYHRSAGVNRADSEMKGQQSSMIMRLDRNLVWIVAPQQGMYMEMSLQDPQARARMADIPDNDRITDFEFVTQEPVNGVLANKYRIASTDAQGERVEGHVWTSNDHDILVKMDLSDGRSRAVMELRDLDVSPQPDALFEPPAGYRRMALGVAGPGGQQTEENFAAEVTGEAVEEARRTTQDEVLNTVRDNVRDGLRKIFGK